MKRSRSGVLSDSRWELGLLLLIILLILPALQPLWQTGLQQTDDGMHHLSRLFGLDQAVRAGHPGTRWLAEEGFGYGFPVLNFYAPLTYYIGMLWHWSGLGLVTSLEWMLALGLLLSALAMYLFARRLIGPWGGALASVAYAWAPYHLADVWTRGALAEAWAFVWLPVLMLALWEIARRRSSQEAARSEDAARKAMLFPVLWGGAALAGLILTHNLSVLLAAPLLIGWGLVILLLEARGAAARWQSLGGYVLLILLGVMLSAAFWLPALAEASYIWAGRVPLDFDAWKQQLVAPGYLVARWWVQRYEVLQAVGTLHPLGQAQLLLALIGVGVGVWRLKMLRDWCMHNRVVRWALFVFGALALFALFMQTVASTGIWRSIPGLLLLQFPWRWQAVTALVLAVISGYGIFALTPRPPWASVLGIILSAVLLMSSALPGLAWRQADFPTTDQAVTDANLGRSTLALYDYGRGLWLREYGSDWMFEYMPAWVQAPRAAFFLSAGPSQGGGASLAVTVVPGRQAPLERRYRVAALQPWTMQLHQFYFPGWEAQVDDRTVKASPTGLLALAGIEVPAGEHEIVFRFGSTLPRRIGWVLTLLGVAIWVAAAAWLRRWRWLAVLVLVVACYGGLAAVARQTNPTDTTPAAISADFDGQIQLIGFHAPPAELRPGADSEVILTWLALRQPMTDYKVFVHVIDANGKLWAQHDGEPVFFFSPTTRWQQGEIVEDRHILTWTGQPPSGRFQLRVGLYDPMTGNRLPVLGPDGTVVGDQVLLAEFGL